MKYYKNSKNEIYYTKKGKEIKCFRIFGETEISIQTLSELPKRIDNEIKEEDFKNKFKKFFDFK